MSTLKKHEDAMMRRKNSTGARAVAETAASSVLCTPTGDNMLQPELYDVVQS
jgi:hypothetical protein